MAGRRAGARNPSVNAVLFLAQAAALWPLYAAKSVVRQLVVVSDEEENEHYKGFSFAELFTKYEREARAGPSTPRLAPCSAHS